MATTKVKAATTAPTNFKQVRLTLVGTKPLMLKKYPYRVMYVFGAKPKS